MTVAGWADRLATNIQVTRPEGPGPFPVVLLMHGCGGLQPFMQNYADAAVQAGFAAVIVDSFTPRGLSRVTAHLVVCTGLGVHGQQRAADIFAMLHWLKGQDWADADHVAVGGWSHGGWTILDALALTPATTRATGLIDVDLSALSRLKTAFLVYPYAGPFSVALRRGWGDRAPRVAAVLGGKDQVVGFKPAEKALARLTADGVGVETLKFDDATHAFDDDRASDPRTRHRPDYAERTRAFFARALTAGLA
ncbi:dienelactone hydrolase family protein [Caulobacter sp. NIBR2454]|uniref:dienelactone hydrolase family protein n=1 Tax=Caulobacter sp. NIBR2454 TaxID=3015996 RepID=UPI0022B652E0|nr:prolyl oligopeptidase family serine peptidase [Caulobacter sp. NIBR2454]